MTTHNSRDRSAVHPAPGLLDIEGAANRLGVPVRHLRRLVAERRIPFVKWGARLHFDPAEVDSWVDRHRTPERGVS